MKRIMIFLAALCFVSKAFTQLSDIAVTTNKTTSLVFPAAIAHADRGSENILIQKVEKAGNILLVKAGKKNFEQTNLSVITADGKLYSFPVSYQDSPAILIYYPTTPDAATLSEGQLPANDISFTKQPMPLPVIEDYTKGILDNTPVIHGTHDECLGVRAVLAGIYVMEEVLFLQIKIRNSSALNYGIDLIRLSIKDRKSAKRTASQEVDIVPLFMAGNDRIIAPGKETVIAYALPKFTIPNEQFMRIEITEQNGGRNLYMKLSNRKIIRAKQLPLYE